MKIEVGSKWVSIGGNSKVVVNFVGDGSVQYWSDFKMRQFIVTINLFLKRYELIESTDLNIALSDEEHFKSIQHEEYLMYCDKNKKYGNAFGKSVQKYGDIAGLTRMGDKFNRIEQFILNGYEDSEESLEDSLQDLANYSNMMLIEVRKRGKLNERE